MTDLPYKRNTIAFWSVLLFFGILYLVICFCNHYFFRTYSSDYGIYNNAFFDFAHGRVNRPSLFNPPLNNFFQVHMSFTLVVLAPFYWVFYWIFGTYTLLFLQIIFILLGGYGTYLFVKLKSENYWLSVMAMFHYFILWGHYSCLAADYIDSTVAASMVPLFLYFFSKRKFVIATLCFLFITIAKENMPLWLIFVAIFLIIENRKDKKMVVIASIYILFSLTYFLMAFYWWIPSLQDPNLPYWGFAYSALGGNVKDAVIYLFSHPIDSFFLLFENKTGDYQLDGIKAEFYYVVLISGGFLIFLRPKYIILFIPIVAQKMYNDNFLRWGINSFYSIEVVSILSLAIFGAFIWIKSNKVRYALAGLICLSTTIITCIKLDHRTSLYYSDSAKEKFYSPEMYKTDFDVKKIYKHFKNIPENAKVCASETIVPHFAYRRNIQVFPFVYDADYIILLLDHSTYPLTKEQFAAKKKEFITNPQWTTIVDDYPLLILKKG